MAAIVLFAAVAAIGDPASAQIGGASAVITVPGSVESDQPVEQATGDIDTVQLPPIVSSLTTVTQGSTYQSNTPFISNLDQALFAGVNSQNDAALMPVTLGLPCDSYTPMIQSIAPALMNTYLGAINVVQQQEKELQSEDFSAIAANVQAPAELAVTQAVGQALLAVVKELQLIRQQNDTLITIEATDKLHQLDATVRPTMPRQGGGC